MAHLESLKRKIYWFLLVSCIVVLIAGSKIFLVCVGFYVGVLVLDLGIHPDRNKGQEPCPLR